MKKFLFLGIICLNHAVESDELNDKTFGEVELDKLGYVFIRVLYEKFRDKINYENQLKLFMKYEEKGRGKVDSESYSELISLREARDYSRSCIKTKEEKEELMAFLKMSEEWDIRRAAKSANFHARERAIASQCQVNIFNSLRLSKLSDEELEKVTGHKIPRIIPDEEPVNVDIHIPQQSDASIKRDKIYDSKMENFHARERAICSLYGKANFDSFQLSKLSDEELEKATGHKIPRIIPDDEPVKVNLGLPQKSDAASNDQLQLTMLEDETLHNYQQIHHSEPLHNRTSTPWWTMAIGCVIFIGSAVGITYFVALKNKKKNEVKFDEQDFYDQNKTIKN